MAATLNPLADLRASLKEAEDCDHHPPVAVSTSREEAKQWWNAFEHCRPSQRNEHLRWMGAHDLFFLLLYILKRTHLDTQFHFERCQEVQEHPYNYIDLWHRESGKSEIITFGQNIRDVICDQNVTIGIFSHSRPMAKSFLRLIKNEMEQNELLWSIWPDIFWSDPVKQSPKWSEDTGLTVKRTTNRKEATFEAWGLVDSQPTGCRFVILHYDDVVGRDECSPDMIEKVNRAFDNSLALTASDPPLFRYLATYQEIGDTTHQMVQKKFAPVRFHPAINAEGQPVLFTAEKLSWFRSRVSPKMFALQYLLDPELATQNQDIGFSTSWIRKEIAPPSIASLNIYIVVDPAGNTRRNSNSRYALWVAGVDGHKKWHILDGVCDKMGLTERGDTLIAKIEKWKPLKVGYETYGMQGDVEYCRERVKLANLTTPIVALSGQENQDDRIEGLMPDFREGRMLLPAAGIPHKTKAGELIDVVEQFLGEYSIWPYGRTRDLLDALSRVRDPKLGVIYPRIYGDQGSSTHRFGSVQSGVGTWMSE